MLNDDRHHAVDYVAYHRSISEEFKATEKRVQNLIADNHWPTDGEQREIIFRKTLRAHIPEAYGVARGFICYETEPSSQLDVLVIKKSHPTLFKEGDLVMVTPDCVEAIIEVKTDPDVDTLRAALTGLADQAEKVRRANSHDGINPSSCWAGLFVFRGPERNNGGAITRRTQTILERISEIADEDEMRVINCISLGPSLFVRYWRDGADVNSEIVGSVWHSYSFADTTHQGLAPAYFVSNLIWALMKHVPRGTEYAYFPIRDRGGKERYRNHFVSLIQPQVTRFSRNRPE